MDTSISSQAAPTLPLFLIKRILFFVDYQDLVSVSLVNRAFHNVVIYDEELWRNQFLIEYGDTVPFILNLTKKVTSQWKNAFFNTKFYPGYQWNFAKSENEDIIEVKFPIPVGTTSNNLQIQVTKTTIQAGLKNQIPIIQGTFAHPMDADEMTWQIENCETVSGKKLPFVFIQMSPSKMEAYKSSKPLFLLTAPRIKNDPYTLDRQSWNLLAHNIPGPTPNKFFKEVKSGPMTSSSSSNLSDTTYELPSKTNGVSTESNSDLRKSISSDNSIPVRRSTSLKQSQNRASLKSSSESKSAPKSNENEEFKKSTKKPSKTEETQILSYRDTAAFQFFKNNSDIITLVTVASIAYFVWRNHRM